MSIMNRRILFLALITPSILAYAQSDDDLYRETQLEISLAYSQCAAFYNLAASDSSLVTGLSTEEAGAMEDEAMTRAMLHAADVEGGANGRHSVNENFIKTRSDLSELAATDPEAFAEAMSDYRRSCRMGVIDPSTFIRKTLTIGRWHSPTFRLPEGVTITELVKNAKSVERVPEIPVCSRPAVGHLLSLDDVLVEGGMICTKHNDGICDSERNWMSYAQYVEDLYPDNELLGYTEKLSISFKGGKTLQKRTLTACLVVPEVRT